MNLRELCDGEPEAKCIRLEILVNGKVVGRRETSVDELLRCEHYTLPIIGQREGAMTLQILHYNVQLRHSFLDLLQNGLQINLIAALGMLSRPFLLAPD